MANELTYQSVFTGQEMDERFTAVAQLQAALLEVETALSAKYVKPASGIPETDLDSAVQSALAKARSAVQDLSNYYTKTEIDSLLAAVNSQEYVDVATLPTASASTLGKIYLVGPTDNQYDRYYTSYDGSAYSWVAAGSTEINLSNYATKAELNQLALKKTTIDLSLLPTSQAMINSSDKWINNSSYATVLVPITPNVSYKVKSQRDGNMYIALLKTDDETAGETPDFCVGYSSRILIEGGSEYSFTAPSDAVYMYLSTIEQVIVTSTVNRIDDLEGRMNVVDQELTEFASIDISEITGSHYIINSSGSWTTSNNYDTVLVPIEPGKTYKLVNFIEGNNYYAPLTSNAQTSGTAVSFASGYSGRVLIPGLGTAVFIAPADAHYLYVIRKYQGNDLTSVYGCESQIYTRVNDCEARIAECEEAIVVIDKIVEVEMELERGAYDASGNYNIGYVLDEAYLRTPNFLKLPADGVWGVRTDSSATMVVLRYFREDYTFLSGVSATALESSGFTEFTAPEGAVFVKMNFRNSTTTDITPGKAYFRGKFGEETPIYYNIRPADNGYQTIEVRVNLYNPTACDATTDAVQDDSAVGVDYGVLAIPAQYVNRGTPTRLIIYCHGAAVNYSSGANRFDSQDLDPAFWLSEGYAVMDVEGNPFNNTDEHFGIPQAYQCYKAAYEWVISHYNIRRDGVFLGGRSMGGLMTLDIITQERGIPVIAACPNVPCVIPTWYWNYMNADRRTFCANHLGFTNQPTWTGTSPMPSAEWDCLKANFDKLALVSPFWRLLNDLPDKDDLFDGTNVSKSSNDPTPLLAVYGNCRLRVKTPVKMFLCRDDDTSIPEMNGDILAKIARQSGQIFVVRNFLTGGHHYDTQNQDLQVTITNTYGESITTSVVYIEMLAWWREWEQRG